MATPFLSKVSRKQIPAIVAGTRLGWMCPRFGSEYGPVGEDMISLTKDSLGVSSFSITCWFDITKS
jgi:hypothetical protein